MSKNWRETRSNDGHDWNRPANDFDPAMQPEETDPAGTDPDGLDDIGASSKDWRERSTKRKPVSATRKQGWKFAALAMVLLCVIGGVVWKIISNNIHRITYLEPILVDSPERLTLPPILFENEDLDDARRIAGEKRFLQSLGPNELGTDLNSRRIEQFRKKLKARLKTPSAKDRIIVYVTGYGVSASNEPFLLCQDYTLRDPNGEALDLGKTPKKFAVSELIDEMIAASANTKLLVLDASHVVYDPRLGIVYNDFQRAVEATLKSRAKDSTMWVLCSSSLGQKPLPLPKGDGSVFGKYFFDALLGRDDGVDDDDDGQVSLKELFRHVWTKTNSLGQTPLLMRPEDGLIGTAEIPDQIVLARIPKKAETEDEQKSQDQAPSTAGDTGETESENKPSSVATQTVADSNGDEPNPTPADDGNPKKTDDQLFNEGDLATRIALIWKKRDELLTTDWNPKFYAPHVWRQLNAMLVDLEQRARGGQDPKDQIDEEIRRTFAALSKREVRSTGQIDSAMTAVELIGRQRESEDWLSPSKSGDLVNCRHLISQIKYDLVAFVRWHGNANLIKTGPRDSARLANLCGNVRRVAKDVLARVIELDELLDRNPEAATESIDDVKELMNDCSEAREKIFTSVVDSAKEQPNLLPVATFKHIELLLRTPLPTSLERGAMQKLLGKTMAEGLEPAPVTELPNLNSEKALQLQLESQLLGVAPKEQNDHEIAVAYAGLPDQTPVSRWLVDPRDAGLVELANASENIPAETLLTHIDPRNSRNQTVPVAPNERVKIELSCDTTDENVKTWTATPTWDEGLITVVDLQHGQLHSRDINQPLRFEVRLADVADSMKSALPIAITFRVEVGTTKKIHRVPISRDEVAIDFAPATLVKRSNGTGWLKLTPFPGRDGRDTAFSMYLRNINKPTGPDGHGPVNIKVYALPSPKTIRVENIDRTTPATVLRREEFRQRIRDVISDFRRGGDGGCRLVAPSPPPPGPDGLPGKETTFDLPLPGKRSLVEFPSAVEEESNQETPDKLLVDVANGLLVVVTDRMEKQQFFPIEVDPLRPRDYLDVDFSVRENSIEATFRPKDDNLDGQPDVFPQNVNTTPVEALWESWSAHPNRQPIAPKRGANPRKASLEGQPKGAIGVDLAPAKLTRSIALRSDESCVVRFTVDGYPRAFVYEIPFGRDPIDLESSLTAIRINTIEMQGPRVDAAYVKNFRRRYHTWDESFRRDDWNSSRHYLEVITPDVELQSFFYGGDRVPVAAFPQSERLKTEVQVDCPRDIFRAVRVGFGRTRNLLTQRRRTIGANVQSGRLVLNTHVADHLLDVDFGFVGRQQLEAELFTTDKKERKDRDYVSVIGNAQSEPPQYRLMVLGDDRNRLRNMTPGDAWRVRLEPIEDQSAGDSGVGLEEARIFLFPNTGGAANRQRPASDKGSREIIPNQDLFYQVPSLPQGHYYFHCWYTDQLGRPGSTYIQDAVGILP